MIYYFAAVTSEGLLYSAGNIICTSSNLCVLFWLFNNAAYGKTGQQSASLLYSLKAFVFLHITENHLA